MKHRFPGKLNPRLIIAFTILLAAFIIHSCKKDNSTHKQQPEALNTAMVDMAKKWYNATYSPISTSGKLVTQSIGGGANVWNQTFIPYWDKANIYTIDSLGYIELPALKRGDMAMSYKNVNPASFNFGKPQSNTSLIIVNKNGNFFMYAMTILADSSYLNGDFTKLAKNNYRYKDNNFSGNVIYHRMDGSFVNGWRFENGLIAGTITLAPPGTPAGPVTQGSNPVVNVAQQQSCQTTITTTYWEQCSYYTNDYSYAHPFNCFIYTTQDSYTTCSTQSTGGGSSSTTPCTPPPAGGGSSTPPVVNATRFKDLIADPNPPNGGTNPPGGIVDQTNHIGTSDCTTQAPADTAKITPCALLKHLDSLLQNAQVSRQTPKFIMRLARSMNTGLMLTWPDFRQPARTSLHRLSLILPLRA